MKRLLFLTCFLFGTIIQSEAQDVEWIRSLKGKHYDHFMNCSTDSKGNVIVSGLSSNEDFVFNPELPIKPSQNGHGTTQIIAKYSPQGELLWIAVSIYVLVAIAKKRFVLKNSLYEILQIISLSIFDKMPINQLFQSKQLQKIDEPSSKQLSIFDL